MAVYGLLLPLWFAAVTNMCGGQMESGGTINMEQVFAGSYVVGVGRADITGPAAEINMMGYVNPSQASHGIHFRLYSRAFIVADNRANSTDRVPVIFVNVDACMIPQAVKQEVVNKLRKMYGQLYTTQNVCLSGIHTHSGPGGYHHYLLLDISSLGFIKKSFDALVSGIVLSIKRAHETRREAEIYINQGELMNTNINRSPTAYLNNPAEERHRYKYNVDKTMHVVTFIDVKINKPFGMISWFPVHCTSMNNTNKLISGDNKGYASFLMERDVNGGSFSKKDEFIAAFATSNEGDVSPNTRGPHCQDTGLPCDLVTSTCKGKNSLCVASGPGKDMFESTRIIGENQYKKAKTLLLEATRRVSGPVDYKHQFVDMTRVDVRINSTHSTRTCQPAMGFSFAAGTTDGPGAFSFKQGDTHGNVFWKLISEFIKTPSSRQIECHRPKPILLDTGEMTRPYLWQPKLVETQILRIGSLLIVSLPGEFTTMSGRRLRKAVLDTVRSPGGEFGPDTQAVLAGLSNSYADYIATYDEYQAQRYEGASTIYGPHTLQAYIQQFTSLARALVQHGHLSNGPTPPDLSSKQITLMPGVVHDGKPFYRKFGDVVKDANLSYKQGSRVDVSFITGHPRNNLKLESTFLEVQEVLPDGGYLTVFTDSDWCTKYRWVRTNYLLSESNAVISWDIAKDQKPGLYRIVHYGDAKSWFTVVPFVGHSRNFYVISRTRQCTE